MVAKKTPPKKAEKAPAKKSSVAREAPAPAPAKKAASPKKAPAAPAAPAKAARRPRPGNPNADPSRIHREYVERYIGGGGEPTERAYADGLQQWRNLPGAVNSSASVVEPAPESDESHHDQDR